MSFGDFIKKIVQEVVEQAIGPTSPQSQATSQPPPMAIPVATAVPLDAGTALPQAIPVAIPVNQGSSSTWLPGSWAGTAIAHEQSPDGMVTQGPQEIPFEMSFDAQGRPLMIQSAMGWMEPLTHVGQTYRTGSTTYEVRELAWSLNELRVVIATLRERVQQYAGVWGVGVASSAEMSTMASVSEWQFRREGQGLRVTMRTGASYASSLRVLDTYSMDREQKEMHLTGLLFHK